MIVAVFTKVRGIACFQIFTPQKPGTGSQKIGSERVNRYIKTTEQRTIISSYNLRANTHNTELIVKTPQLTDRDNIAQMLNKNIY